MSNFDPIRDCPHGRQKGKCDSCDLEQAEKIIEQQQKRITELERKLQLEEELHHTTESGYTELFATIKQQQQQITELEDRLKESVKHNQISQLIGEKNTFRRVSAMSVDGWLKRKMNSEIARVNRRIEEIKEEKEDE